MCALYQHIQPPPRPRQLSRINIANISLGLMKRPKTAIEKIDSGETTSLGEFRFGIDEWKRRQKG